MPDLRVARPDTIRTRLEAIRDRHRTVINGIGIECGCAEGCAGTFPCADNLDAVAALELLEKARHAYRCRPGCWDCEIRDEPWRDNDVRIALIDDPERDAK